MPAGVGQPHVRIRELTVGGTRVSLEDARAPRASRPPLAAGRHATPRPGPRSPPSRRIRVYEGEVESLSDAGGRGVGVRAFVDGRVGLRLRHRPVGRRACAEVAGAARAAAEVADPDEHGGLPDEFGATAVDGLASPALRDWTTERKVELALAVERAARAREGVTQVENAVYSDAEGSVALANSRGFAAGYDATQAWAYASAFAGEGADLMTGLGVGLGRDPAALDPEAIGDEAAERALALVGARQPESRRCPVVLDAFVAASLHRLHRLDAVRRRGAARPLAVRRPRGRRGRRRRAARSPTTATDPEGPASAPFDGEGSPTRRTPLIEDGRLLTLPVRRAHGAQGGPRHDRQRRAAAPTARRRRSGRRTWCSSRARTTSTSCSARPARACS